MNDGQNLERQFKTEQIPNLDQAGRPEKVMVEATPSGQNDETSPAATAILPDVAPMTTPDPNQIILEKVESILASDLENVFLEMDVASQAAFKAKGEETAKAITVLLQKTKVQARKILDLIVAWLRLIPHVNKYYLEQEAKIKADAIMHLNKKL